MIDTEASSVSGFLDTSVIVRYLIQDDPNLGEQARRIIDECPSLIIPAVTIAETAFVLTSFYSMPRVAVVDALIALIQRHNVSVDQLDTDIVIQALMLCRPSVRVSFADAMLWASARQSGTGSVVYSFDRRFPSMGITLRSEAPDQRPGG
jgi:predicted nucleic acid-binding protein